MALEQRTMIPINGSFSTREVENDLFIEGYFSVFNSPYDICPGLEVVISSGAFTDRMRSGTDG